MPHPPDLAQALALHQAGRTAEARRACERILGLRPEDPNALHLSALIALAEGRRREGIALLERCAVLRPGWAEALTNLGNALLSDGRPAQAEAAQRLALAAAPDLPAIHGNLGNALQALGRFAEAEAAYRAALALNPRLAGAHNNLGSCLKARGRTGEAIAAYARAIELDPTYAEAFCNLGNALAEGGRLEDAEVMLRRAVELAPKNAPLSHSLGALLKTRGRTAEAITELRRALALRPRFPEALTTLGDTLASGRAPGEAVDAYREALALAPNHVEALSNLGNTLTALNRPEEALPFYGRARTLRPADADIRYNEALARLALGDFEGGWAGYDSRWERRRSRGRRALPGEAWDGRRALSGLTLLVYAEQGLGDTIMFVRHIPELLARGVRRLILEVQPPLERLLRGQSYGGPGGPVEVVARGRSLPAFDLHVALLTLPGLLGVDREWLSRTPAPTSYLKGPMIGQDWVGAREQNGRESGGDAPGGSEPRGSGLSGARPRVGLVWSGNQKHLQGLGRSMEFGQVAALVAGAPQVSFYSLQKEYRPGEAQALAGLGRVRDLSGQLGDFADTAAIVGDLDLLITIDTSVAHLGGALGIPTWIMLRYAADWRWFLGRGDSPWYASVRLFRQPALGDWESVGREVGRGLADRFKPLL